jgi:hypothetical protein
MYCKHGNYYYMSLPVATDLKAVSGEWRVRRFDEINLPVKADRSEVLLLLVLVLPPRNLSSQLIQTDHKTILKLTLLC